MHRSLAPVALLGVLAAALGCPGNITECECFFVDRAVHLTVIDAATMRGIDDFFVEVITNDVPQGEPPECSAAFREGNGCAFGDEPGIYHIIVRAPGYFERETVVRLAEEENSEICCNARLAAKEVELALDAVSP